MYIEQTKSLTTTGGLLSKPKRLNTEESNPFNKNVLKMFNDKADAIVRTKKKKIKLLLQYEISKTSNL